MAVLQFNEFFDHKLNPSQKANFFEAMDILNNALKSENVFEDFDLKLMPQNANE